jgi:hypothetical protein
MPQSEDVSRQAARTVLKKLGDSVFLMVQAQLKQGYDIDLEGNFDYGVLLQALSDVFGTASQLMVREIQNEKMRCIAANAT